MGASNKVLGANIKKLMAKSGFTAKKLAEKVGVSATHLSYISNGKRTPSLDLVQKIAETLNVPVERLTGEALSCIIENRLEEMGMTLQELAEKSKVPLVFLQNLDDIIPGNDVDGGEQCYSYMSAIAWILDLPASQLRAALARQEIPVYDPELESCNLIKELSSPYRGEPNILTAHIPSNVDRIPVLGSIPAGVPVEAVQDIIGYEEIPQDWLNGDRQYFGLLVKGDSMYPEYLEGDVVIVRKQSCCDSGDDCAVVINNTEATLKRVRLFNDAIELEAINKMYGKRRYTNEEIEKLPVTILGVIVELRRKKK